MFDNVLVGIDGHGGGQDAIALAKQLASERARITLVTVHEGRLNPIHGITPGMVSEERTAARELLRRERDAAAVSAAVIEVEATSAGRGLHQQAEDEDADLLVVGSRGYGPLRRLVLGSTSNYLARHAHCSLLVLPRSAAEREPDEGQARETVGSAA